MDERKMSAEERWNSATIANNFIFYKVMKNNPDVCRELLEILLEMEIERIHIYSEESIEVDFGSKGIRMDVFAKNETQAFNIEMQASDTKELPERARYYQGVMDVDNLKSGQKYRELKDSYVVFICIQDIFAKGLPVYTFENLCRENTEISLGDRTQKCFFIADNCDKILNERQKAFLKLAIGQKGSDSFTRRIESLAEDAKHNIQWKRQYMEWERQRTYDYEDGREAGISQGIAQGFSQGISQGVHDNAVSNATNLLREGIAPDVIARCVGLSLDEVLSLKDEAANKQ